MAGLEETRAKIRRQEVITVNESIQYLISGNREIAKSLHQKKASMAHPYEYDVLLVACSDARCEATALDDYVLQKILAVQLAGNVVSSDLDNLLSKIKQKGDVINCGHINCGACDAKSHQTHYQGISPSIDTLLSHVDVSKKTSFAKDIFSGNAINQAEKLKHNEAITNKKASVTAVLLDFFNASEPLRFLRDGAPGLVVEKMKANAARMVGKTKNEGKTLATQYAHAIIVSDPADLGIVTNSRVLFDAGLNELFCVSANNGKLSASAVASIEYALLKVGGVKDFGHVVVLHSSDAGIIKLRDELLESRIIKEKTKNGETITLMKYDKASGEVR